MSGMKASLNDFITVLDFPGEMVATVAILPQGLEITGYKSKADFEEGKALGIIRYPWDLCWMVIQKINKEQADKSAGLILPEEKKLVTLDEFSAQKQGKDPKDKLQ